MKKLPVIAGESLEAVLDEVSKEITKVLAKTPSKGERIALSAFFGTMTKTTLDILNGIIFPLANEEREDILTACGTWFDIGMLAGRSPELLVAILKRANAKIEEFTPPEWFMEKDRAIAEAEEIVRHYVTD